MRRWLPAFALASLLAAPAWSATITYVANMDGLQENPVNASGGTGVATLVVDTTAHTASLSVTFSGLASTTLAAHIHCCVDPPANVGVAIGSTGFPTGVLSGTFGIVHDLASTSTYDATFLTNNGGTAAGAEAALLAGLAAGRAYYNIHTNAYPGGEIRAFFAVPEPASGALLVAAALWVARRKRASPQRS
jgi:hypothetical protein